MERRRILMTASTFPRWEGDTEPRFILDLAKAVSRYCDVTVLAPAAIGAKDHEVLEGVEVIRYHYMPFKKWETLCYPGAIVPRIKEKKTRALQVPFLILALWFQLLRRKKDYDLIHDHWLIPQGIVQAFAGGKYIVTGHGDDVTSMNKGLLKTLKQRCLRRAKYVTIVSDRLKQILTDTYSLQEDKIRVISMGCDVSSFSPLNRREDVFPDNGKKNIVYVGRLVERKGVPYLIDAMKSIDANLYIVGTGPDESALREQAEAAPEKIHFLGSKTHQELAEIYASADLCVFPSIRDRQGKEEGFGLVILEAMASGTPVVASRSGGIVDIIEDGVNGLLAEPKDSIKLSERINQILSDPVLSSRLAQAGLVTASKYNYTVIAELYQRIYEKAV